MWNILSFPRGKYRNFWIKVLSSELKGWVHWVLWVIELAALWKHPIHHMNCGCNLALVSDWFLKTSAVSDPMVLLWGLQQTSLHNSSV
jgi:hypothetical protein